MKIRRSFLHLVPLSLLAIFTNHALADTFARSYSIRETLEFESNPLYIDPHGSGVWRALVEPAYLLATQEGANDIKAGLGLQMERSSNQALSRNRQSPNALLDWLHQSDYGSIDVTSSYSQVATRNASGVDSSGVALVNGTQTTKTLSGTWIRALNDRNSFDINEAAQYITYGGGYVVNNVGTYVDYGTQTTSLTYKYATDEETTSYANVSHQEYRPTFSRLPESLSSYMLGVEHKGEYVDYTLEGGTSHDTNGYNDLLGNILVHYKGQSSKLDLTVNHLVLPSGVGGFIYVDDKKIDWSYDVTEYSVAGVDIERVINSQSIISDGKSSIGGVWVKHDFSELWNLKTYFIHKQYKVGVANGAYSNTIGVTLSYSSPSL